MGLGWYSGGVQKRMWSTRKEKEARGAGYVIIEGGNVSGSECALPPAATGTCMHLQAAVNQEDQVWKERGRVHIGSAWQCLAVLGCAVHLSARAMQRTGNGRVVDNEQGTAILPAAEDWTQNVVGRACLRPAFAAGLQLGQWDTRMIRPGMN